MNIKNTDKISHSMYSLDLKKKSFLSKKKKINWSVFQGQCLNLIAGWVSLKNLDFNLV
jgi:hypothetical protein